MVCEPAAVATNYASRAKDFTSDGDDWIDDLDWDKFPNFGPFSDKEAIARVREAEKDLKDSSKWIQIDDLHAELKRLHSWL